MLARRGKGDLPSHLPPPPAAHRRPRPMAADLARLHEANTAPDSETGALTQKVLTQKTDHMLQKLVKMYMGLCSEEQAGETEAAAISKASLLKDLHLFEFEVAKAKRMAKMNERELKNYAEKQAATEVKVDEAKLEIEQLKKDLAAAKIERRQKEEYDMIGRKILELPPRDELESNMAQLRADICALEAEDAKLTATHDHRSKQFRLLMHLVMDLESSLEREESEAAIEGVAQARAEHGGEDEAGQAAKKRKVG